ncbi:Uncharacterised protein [Mycobacteroides abscessus subsp. abscessus]|uniref:hypothetical protein n=1 Tax=Mycobacteroides abscessus TaxID=36809 RepID=UPI00092CA21B|nr:hypothetical protein [Mycobacteroides abscessus]MBN7564505.1 hypothetical protein [Mycobacteroides abscessus subsp. massiliense]SID68393.1 Uncharacterised protein [Mycobacteroides abscessus subsp. abscessus]SIF77202.1 Uncharacterised protein [Mycobacteroides abscessus subsp. abscessus]SIG16489.1 Uncharacterised protein [Mycobacteroides abscessus subsp. abscessus]SIH64271.1 Uncharacterised protein [Mycobacteroides abscessus subsp. abscessus]
MTNTQSRTDARTLTALAIALGVGLGVVGCSSHPTTPTGAGETSTSAEAHELVDVAAVWAEHPLPPCPRMVIGNVSAPAGLELPSDDSVAAELRGVKSPAPESWVREKLSWVTQWLSQTRAGIVADPGVGAKEQGDMFTEWVTHVREELRDGHDIASDLDGAFPEGCA